jgi:D-lactate dehydrogenase
MSRSLQKRMHDDMRNRFCGPPVHQEVISSSRNWTSSPDRSRSQSSLPPIDATLPVGHHGRSASPDSPMAVAPVRSCTSLPMLSSSLRPALGAGRLKSDGPTFQIAMFSAQSYDRAAFDEQVEWLNKNGGVAPDCLKSHPVQVRIVYIEEALGDSSVGLLPPGTNAVCGFVNDQVSEAVLEQMAKNGVKLMLNRSAGFNNVDIHAADKFGIRVMRVPSYSPQSVAEHGVALLMAVNRKTHEAHEKCRMMNFSLEGLEGFQMHGKTVAVLGAGNIGILAARIYLGFGMRVLYYNRSKKPELEQLNAAFGPWEGEAEVGGRVQWLPMYKLDPETNKPTREKDPDSLRRVCELSDVISIHAALNPDTFHMLNEEAFSMMRRKPVIVNVARGDLIDTKALVAALQNGTVLAAGLDVVEGEAGVFFGDHSQSDDAAWQDGAKATMKQLLEWPTCMVTGHQGFLTHDALEQIAKITLTNAIDHFDDHHPARAWSTLS